jgi:hypothetical protein
VSRIARRLLAERPKAFRHRLPAKTASQPG